MHEESEKLKVKSSGIPAKPEIRSLVIWHSSFAVTSGFY
jgi:hypothetical protein